MFLKVSGLYLVKKNPHFLQILISFLFEYLPVRNIQTMEETVLFSGPLNFIQVVLPLGSYVVYAEIFDEAGAFATFIIKKNMNLLHQNMDICRKSIFY